MSERQAPPTDLRKQVKEAIWQAAWPWVGRAHADRIAGYGGDNVLAVFAEREAYAYTQGRAGAEAAALKRERLLRERIEALTMHHAAESGLGAMLRRRDVLAEIDRHA